MLRRRRFHDRHRRLVPAAPVASAPPSIEKSYLTLVEARAKTLSEYERLKEEGSDKLGEVLTLGLAVEAASRVEPMSFRSKRSELETGRQQFDECLEALQFFIEQFDELLAKYRREKPTELAICLTAKIKEHEAFGTHPGPMPSDVASRLERLRAELAAIEPSTRSRPKSKRKSKSS